MADPETLDQCIASAASTTPSTSGMGRGALLQVASDGWRAFNSSHGASRFDEIAKVTAVGEPTGTISRWMSLLVETAIQKSIDFKTFASASLVYRSEVDDYLPWFAGIMLGGILIICVFTALKFAFESDSSTQVIRQGRDIGPHRNISLDVDAFAKTSKRTPHFQMHADSRSSRKDAQMPRTEGSMLQGLMLSKGHLGDHELPAYLTQMSEDAALQVPTYTLPSVDGLRAFRESPQALLSMMTKDLLQEPPMRRETLVERGGLSRFLLVGAVTKEPQDAILKVHHVLPGSRAILEVWIAETSGEAQRGISVENDHRMPFAYLDTANAAAHSPASISRRPPHVLIHDPLDPVNEMSLFGVVELLSFRRDVASWFAYRRCLPREESSHESANAADMLLMVQSRRTHGMPSACMFYGKGGSLLAQVESEVTQDGVAIFTLTEGVDLCLILCVYLAIAKLEPD